MGRPFFFRREVPTDPQILTRYANEHSVTFREASEQYSDYLEKLEILRIKLKRRLYILSKKTLTPHQYEVFTLMMQGHTYKDMATILGINYTAIPHAIQGIKQRSDKYKGTYHGGIYKKLRKKCAQDALTTALLKEIHDLTHAWNLEAYEPEDSWYTFLRNI